MDDATTGTPVGPYGTVIEHPILRGLRYMVIGPTGNWRAEQDFYGVVVSDTSGLSQARVAGEVLVLGHYIQTGERYTDWIVVE